MKLIESSPSFPKAMSFFDFSLKAKAERPVVPAVDRVAKVQKTGSEEPKSPDRSAPSKEEKPARETLTEGAPSGSVKTKEKGLALNE